MTPQNRVDWSSDLEDAHWVSEMRSSLFMPQLPRSLASELRSPLKFPPAAKIPPTEKHSHDVFPPSSSRSGGQGTFYTSYYDFINTLLQLLDVQNDFGTKQATSDYFLEN